MNVSALYVACRNGDLNTVEELLPTLTLDQINQIEPNGSTSLHAACYYNHPQIVKLLLDSGALRTTLNSHGCTAFDEATSEQVKQLFPRSFAAAQVRFSAEVPSKQTIEWASLEYGTYGWQEKKCINNIDIDKAVDGLGRDERFHDASSTHLMEYFLNKARQVQDPKWLIQAYSAETGFYQVINKALALEPLFTAELKVNKSFHSFVGVFLYHKALKKYRYTGKCYRGMKLSTKDFEENYKVGEQLLIKPFISTSKSRHIAEQFATTPPISSRPLSVLCIYTIPDRTLSYRDNVALDISSISQYPHEEEVLILPYTSLQVQSINHLPSGLIEIEMGWYSFIQKGVIT
jgi:hypothetical protein